MNDKTYRDGKGLALPDKLFQAIDKTEHSRDLAEIIAMVNILANLEILSEADRNFLIQSGFDKLEDL